VSDALAGAPWCPVLQDIIVFKKQQLFYYAGNYDEYEQQVRVLRL